jgi:hypothetical protein
VDIAFVTVQVIQLNTAESYERPTATAQLLLRTASGQVEVERTAF